MMKQTWVYILQYLLNGGSVGERIQLGLALNTLRISYYFHPNDPIIHEMQLERLGENNWNARLFRDSLFITLASLVPTNVVKR